MALGKAETGGKGGKSALYETLKRRILTLELAPDDDLDEAGLSEEYGISRTPVRDILRQLAGEGYVDIRENRGARVIPMNHSTVRDFFLVAPLIYEAVGRLAIQNFRVSQLELLKQCQERFCEAINNNDPNTMVVENNDFHDLIGQMAHSVFLAPSYNRLLIDHTRIAHIFYRDETDLPNNLAKAAEHHDQMIVAIAERDEGAMVRLVIEHWELSRRRMELFIAPKGLQSEAMGQVPTQALGRKARG